jgi:hypothetical protein
VAKRKYASLTASLIKRVPTRIIGPEGTVDNVIALVPRDFVPLKKVAASR